MPMGIIMEPILDEASDAIQLWELIDVDVWELIEYDTTELDLNQSAIYELDTIAEILGDN